MDRPGRPAGELRFRLVVWVLVLTVLSSLAVLAILVHYSLEGQTRLRSALVEVRHDLHEETLARHRERMEREEQQKVSERTSRRVQGSMVFVSRLTADGAVVVSGVGTFVGPNGDILTADHVVGDTQGLFGFYRENGQVTTGPLEVVERIPEQDLAVLRAPGAPARDNVYLLPSDHVLEPGRELVVWAPIMQRSDLPMFQALPFRTWSFGADEHALFLQLLLLPGCSGSPVVDADGRVGGVYVATRRVETDQEPSRVLEGHPTTEGTATGAVQKVAVEYGRAARLHPLLVQKLMSGAADGKTSATLAVKSDEPI